jgi:hypothetical protein
MQNKTRLELVDYEAENLAKLQKLLSKKWEFIYMQAEAQIKVDKKRDKMERKILDSQERAFWDVHRPAPGCVNTTEVDIRKTMRSRRTDHPYIGFFGSRKNATICSYLTTEKNLANQLNRNGLPNSLGFAHPSNSVLSTFLKSNSQSNNQNLNPIFAKKLIEDEDFYSVDNLRIEKEFLKRRLERRYVKTSRVSER